MNLKDPVLSALLTRRFLRELAINTPVSKELRGAILAEHRRVLAAADPRFRVPSSVAWLVLSSLLLASYRVLRDRGICDGPAALELLKATLVGPTARQVRPYLRLRFGISQRHPERAFDAIRQNMAGRGNLLFGRYWSYEHLTGEERSVHTVKRCLFNDFFRSQAVPELTGLFCELDQVWAQELAQPRYQVAFARPTTLAEGADGCPFIFTRATRR